MVHENIPQSLWNMYGLKYNPFSTDPLLIEEGFISLETFVGREQQLTKIRTLFQIGGGTRIIVTGDTGVGKTSLVNYARSESMKKNNFFTHLREIEVKENWNSQDFISHTLANIYNYIIRTDLNGFSEKLKRKLSLLFDIMEMKDVGFSFDIMGTGVGLNTSKNVNSPTITSEFLKNLFNEVIDEIVRLGYPQIVLHYNNLENIERDRLIRLFVSLRDFLQNERIHFVFVGGEPFPSAVLEVDKVRSIFMYSPIEIPEFTLAEVKNVLHKRIESLSIKGMSALKPYEDDVIKELHSIHKGNIRDILNSLCVAMIEIFSESPNEPIILTKEKLRRVLKKALKERYLSRMSPTDLEVLKNILKFEETTNGELAKILHKKKQNISKNLKKLKRIHSIKEKRIGVEKYIMVTPEMKWMNISEEEPKKDKDIEDKVNKNVQKLMSDWEGR